MIELVRDGGVRPAGSRLHVECHRFDDDGAVPNNPKLPLLVYRRALDLAVEEPEDGIEKLFNANGWGGTWVDGIFPYHHYHSTAHEVLGVAQGRARVQLGGPQGLAAEVAAGDVIVIPAGVGHCLLDADGLSVVGAYPQGQDWDLCRALPEDRQRALHNIPRVPLPKTDPVWGEQGPLHEHWRRQ